MQGKYLLAAEVLLETLTRGGAAARHGRLTPRGYLRRLRRRIAAAQEKERTPALPPAGR